MLELLRILHNETFCFSQDDGDGGSGDDGGDTNAGDDMQDDGAENDQGDGDQKTGDSMLDALSDGEGISFDFTSGEQPDGFPDEYWDADGKQVNVQALFDGLKKQEKIAKDLRSKMGKGDHKPPVKADMYKFDPSEKSSGFIHENDPLVAAAQEVAHETGLSQEQYQKFMSSITDRMVDIIGEKSDPDSEANQQARDQYIKDEIKKIGPNGAQVLRAVQSWGNEMLSQGVFSEADVKTLKEEGLTSAAMVQLFNRIRSKFGGSDIPMDTIDDGLPPDAEIADMIDKAYASKDPAKIREAEKILDKRREAGRPERLQF